MSTMAMQQILQQGSWGERGDTDTGISNTNPTDTDTPLATDRRDWRQVDMLADKLEALFGHQTPSRRPYYCKLAWQLPEGLIWQLAEQAQRGRQPARLFSWLTSKELAQLNRDN
jgi:hypothetical protein